MADAIMCGVTPLDDVDAFVEACVVMGEGFVHRTDLPWAATVLRDGRAGKERRLLELAHIVRATEPEVG